MQFVVSIPKRLVHQTAREIISLLVSNVCDKTSQKIEIDEMFAIYTRVTALHSSFNFALALHENAFVFSQ